MSLSESLINAGWPSLLWWLFIEVKVTVRFWGNLAKLNHGRISLLLRYFIMFAATLLPIIFLESILEPLPFLGLLTMCLNLEGGVSQMFLKSYIVLRPTWPFISSQPSEEGPLLLNNTKGRDTCWGLSFDCY